METNEIMATGEQVIEATKVDVVNAGPKVDLKLVAGAGVCVLAGALICKFAPKVIAKVKEKREARKSKKTLVVVPKQEAEDVEFYEE